MKFIRKRWYILIIVLLAIGGIWFVRRPKPQGFREYTVTRQPLVVTLSASGSIQADRKADLTFQTGGRLSWIGVQEGQHVKKWQGIASLDQRTLQKNLQKELNDYLTSRWNFQDTRDAYSVTTDSLDAYTLSAAARRVLERSQFTLNNSVLDVEIQVVSKEFASLIAPFDGLVTSLPAHVGTNVTSTTPVATVVDPSSLYFEAQVDELDIGKINVGQPVTLTLDAYADQPIKAKVTEIGFTSIPLSGGGTGYNIRIELPQSNGDLRYKLGMNGDAIITLQDIPEAIVVPIKFTTQRDGGTTVKKRTATGIEDVFVKLGGEANDTAEVLSGLSEGDKVVIREGK